MAFNVSDQLFEQSTDTNGNFGNSVAGQTNSFFLPQIFSKKVLNFFRKSSVAEAITNTDYAGEISAFGDSVKIIKEPVITVVNYERGADITKTALTDQEITLVVDVANAFKFIVDDIETSMSHVNFKEVATSSAAYALRDAFDAGVIAKMFAGVAASSPNHILGSDNATDIAAGTFDGTGNLDIGFGTSEHDPIDVISRMARLLDEQNVPEEGRWLALESFVVLTCIKQITLPRLLMPQVKLLQVTCLLLAPLKQLLTQKLCEIQIALVILFADYTYMELKFFVLKHLCLHFTVSTNLAILRDEGCKSPSDL